MVLRKFMIVIATAIVWRVAAAENDASLWPIVDFATENTVHAVRSALLTRGFFFARNLLEQDLLSVTYAASRRAHNLPVAEKQLYAGHGYTGTDVNMEELAYEANKKSTVMAWDYAKENNSFVSTDSKYPGNLEAIASQLYKRQAAIAKTVLTAMARSLAVIPEDSFSKHTTGELGSLRLLRYPGVENAGEDLTGVSAHTDFEAFTLMHQDAPGLQVRARGSKVWEDVPIFDDGAVLVIVGDVLERMTNGVLQATPHRVVPTPFERYAIIRFNAFAADTLVEPMPQFCNETNPPAYSSTTMAEIMRVTISNLEAGKGAWDPVTDRSSTVDYDYQACVVDNEGTCSDGRSATS